MVSWLETGALDTLRNLECITACVCPQTNPPRTLSPGAPAPTRGQVS